MTVNALLLMETKSVFVLMDLMVQNVKVTKTEMKLFYEQVVPFCLCYKSSSLWFVVMMFRGDRQKSEQYIDSFKFANKHLNEPEALYSSNLEIF
jgi:hypothetical protein